MELGKIQKQWIANLRAYPEKQIQGILGLKTSESYGACCLGELLLTKCRINNEPLPFDYNGSLYDGDVLLSPSEVGLEYSWGSLGLYNYLGSIKSDIKLKGHVSLAQANDNGVSWPEIADFVEKHPETVFSKSV